MHMCKTGFVTHFQLPTRFDPFCSQHKGSFTRVLRTATMSTNKMHTLRHDYINDLKCKILNVSGLTGPLSVTRHSVDLIIISNVRNCRHMKKVKTVKMY